MTTGVICTPPILAFTLNNGQPAAGGSILTQVGGVNAATYSDSGLTVPLPNPIPLNSRGEISNAAGVSSQLFLTPNTVYVFTLFDGPNGTGNQIWAATYVNGIQVSQASIGQALYPQTSAEQSAGVTPSNYAYPTGNVKRYGAIGDGVTDDSAAFQRALSCNTSVYVPASTYLVSSLVIPSTSGLVLYGDGTSSILKQKADGNPLISWSQSSIVYTEGYIERLAFIGTSGTNHTINTSGVGGITLQDLYFTDVPVGFSSIYCNGAAATYTHDQRLRNIQIYYKSANGGHSGIRLGPLSSDASITDFIMNGGFHVSYCIYADIGAQTHQMSNSHPYNASNNIFFGAGSSGDFTFDNVVFDNATNDLVVLTGFTDTMFSSCWFEATQSGKNSLTLINCATTTLDQVRFDGVGGAAYCVNETGTSNFTVTHSLSSTGISNFNNPPFNLIGASSVYPGEDVFFSGSTSAVIAAGTTNGILGPNGLQTAALKGQWIAPISGGVNIQGAGIQFDVAPGAGQSYTVGLYGNGSLLTAASGSSNPQVFTSTTAATISVAQGAGAFIAQFKSLYLQITTTGAAATPNAQYWILAKKNNLPS
jgi:hypothetical protein